MAKSGATTVTIQRALRCRRVYLTNTLHSEGINTHKVRAALRFERISALAPTFTTQGALAKSLGISQSYLTIIKKRVGGTLHLKPRAERGCSRCGAPRIADATYCREHRKEYMKEYMQEYRRRKINKD